MDLLITPELENDKVHLGLIKRFISFYKVYRSHQDKVKELLDLGIHEANLPAVEKHKRLILERKKIINQMRKEN